MDKMVEDSLKKLQSKIEKILHELLKENGVEVFGNIKVEVVANMNTLAVIKGSKIYVNAEAAHYPKYVLKYIIAHELAHLMVKRHTKKFWEIVKRIYPQYEKGREKLLELLNKNTRNSRKAKTSKRKS